MTNDFFLKCNILYKLHVWAILTFIYEEIHPGSGNTVSLILIWRNNALFFKLSPWSLPVSHANTARFSLQSIVLSAYTASTSFSSFYVSVSPCPSLSLSPSLFSYMTHLSAFCEISASLQAHAGWTKCESEQSVTTLNWELLHCQNTALYTYGGSLQRHKVM